MTGNGTIIARITQNSLANSVAGVMMSETLTYGSRASTVIYDFNGVYMEPFMGNLTTTGGSWALTGGVKNAIPEWLMLVRSNNVFTGYACTDGVSWAEITSASIPMATNIYVGLMVESATTNSLDTATFDNVSVPCMAPASLTSTATDGQVSLSWTACLGATSYNIERGTNSGGPYTTIASVTSPTLSYVDTAVVNGTSYYYVVSAVNAMGVSPNSPQTSAMPQVSTTPVNLGMQMGGGGINFAWRETTLGGNCKC